jgi:putative hydrolase of the HAD superfamily
MNLKNWVVVFDLDDTLISELEYQRSGISSVEAAITSIYGIAFDGRIQRALDDGVKDIWVWACQQLGLPPEVKTSLLWIYRLHSPNIKLFKGVEDLISRLLSYQANLAILSDGRSITQRLKLRTIGLESLPLFISEEYQSVKPEIDRFVSIENKWPQCNYVYIADNSAKDFVAPRSRNWLTLGARWISPRVHCFNGQTRAGNQPDQWLDCPSMVLSVIAATCK